ncbi:zinc ribbon domain-containing protein [Ligilactobacillus murinus]|uniref:zinc ribbon domain-containing protein n=1 Tax=Ligilactobacillus murinus TaxID=1622 RepID=UPI002DD650A4|nr:zinc ribbon domain-containing protein [Ligilactobacillus murinus]WRY37662.1 zinc ribbon domain-containing protein [Ligilactobacillus murinus]
MKYCKNCGVELEPNAKECKSCGLKFTTQGAKDITVDEELKQKIETLENELKYERQNNKVNVFSRLAFTREHFKQVFQFMKDNALTLLIFYFVSILLVETRWLFLGAYLLMIYIYPLLSNEKRFKWDSYLEEFFQDKENLERLRNNIINKNLDTVKQVKQESVEKIQKVQGPQEEKTAREAVKAPRKKVYFSLELLNGIVLAVLGTLLYFPMKAETENLTNQVSSFVTNGELDSSNYLLFWAQGAMIIGILAVIGGVFRLATRNNSGLLAKFISTLVMVGYAGTYTYVYLNPGTTAMTVAKSVISGDSSLSDWQTMLDVVQILPWVAVAIYILGIVINAMHRRG